MFVKYVIQYLPLVLGRVNVEEMKQYVFITRSGTAESLLAFCTHCIGSPKYCRKLTKKQQVKNK